MNLRSAAPVALLAVLALAARAHTDEAPPPHQHEEDLALTLPTDEWYVPKNTLSFGFRVLGQGAKVGFGNLGIVQGSRLAGAISAGSVSRNYDNGRVILDAARLNESLPTSVSPASGETAAYGVYPGTGRYQIFSTTNDGGTLTTRQNADLLSYQQGVTRSWGYSQDSQISGNLVSMNVYTATSEGATAQKDEGFNSGVELSLSRRFGQPSRRFEWALTAGFALNTINAKTSGTVQSTLVTRTDRFQLNGPAPTGDARFVSPTFANLVLPDGSTAANGLETTTTLNDVPVSSNTIETPGGATVNGSWKLKGAYFLLRLGPTLRTQFTERWGMSASIGVAGAYAGTRYNVIEELQITNVTDPILDDRTSTKSKFLPGFYADLNVDWLATERTGLFAGVNMQRLGGYDQGVAGRTAKIDFGNAIGLRGGINIKF
ncbi:MAG: hypothetical protein C0502_03785 [Opitutus sp.]|nr:hypothetical protein [Opitutus sp.]